MQPTQGQSRAEVTNPFLGPLQKNSQYCTEANHFLIFKWRTLMNIKQNYYSDDMAPEIFYNVKQYTNYVSNPMSVILEA